MFIKAERLVDSNLRGGTVGYLASIVIECDSFQRCIVVVVDCLDDGIGATEDGKGTASDVGLEEACSS